MKNKQLLLRSPNSIRPWQHVLDPLYGYLLLLMKLHKKQVISGSSFNFGPNKSSNKSVSKIINLINKNFDNSVEIIKKNSLTRNHKESKVLMLNSYKSKKKLNWNSKYNLNESITITSDWFKHFIDKKKQNILKVTQDQIREYLN